MAGQKSTFVPYNPDATPAPASSSSSGTPSTFKPYNGEPVKPNTKSVMDTLEEVKDPAISMGIGAGLSLMGMPPFLNAMSMAGYDQLHAYYSLPPDERSLSKSIVDFSTESLMNYATGKASEIIPKQIRAARNLLGSSTVPQTFLDLGPTYAQLSGSDMAESLENIAAGEAKKQAVAASIGIAKTQAEDIASQFTGNKTPVKLNQIDILAGKMQNKTIADYRRMTLEARLQAEDIKGISALPTNKTQIQVGMNPGQPAQPPSISNFFLGKPAVPPTPIMQDIAGRVDLDKTLQKVLQMKQELGQTMKTPDPNNPLIRDLDAFLEQVGYDPATGKANPVGFASAWNTKVDYGKAGYEGVKTTTGTYMDVRYQTLNQAIDDDIKASIAKWDQGPAALKAFNNVNKVVADRYALSSPAQIKNLINLRDEKGPSSAITAITNDEVLMQKFLDAGEYKLPDGTVISSLNKRGDLKAYKFMQMWQDNFESLNASDQTQGQFNMDNFKSQWNKYKVSKEGRLLYNAQDIKNIDEFTDNINKLTSSGAAGSSKYLQLRMATGGLRIASVAAAAMLGMGGGPSAAGVAGTVAVTGVILSAGQMGRLLVNKDAAEVLNQMAIGKPLGRSVQGAMQVLAYALRNEKIRALFGNGTEADIELDGKGAPKKTLAPFNSK